MPLGIVDDKETLVRSTARYFGIGTIYATFSIKAPLKPTENSMFDLKEGVGKHAS